MEESKQWVLSSAEDITPEGILAITNARTKEEARDKFIASGLITREQLDTFMEAFVDEVKIRIIP